MRGRESSAGIGQGRICRGLDFSSNLLNIPAPPATIPLIVSAVGLRLGSVECEGPGRVGLFESRHNPEKTRGRSASQISGSQPLAICSAKYPFYPSA